MMFNTSRSTVGLIRVILFVIIFFAGVAKIIGLKWMVQTDESLGVVGTSRYLIGLSEMGAAILLLRQGTLLWGSSLISAMMIGAFVVQVSILRSFPFLPAFTLIFLLILIADRRQEILAILESFRIYGSKKTRR